MPEPIYLRSLQIDRLYGRRHDLKLEPLSEGINVLYGPNGSGKSSVARTLRHLLWPDPVWADRQMPFVRASLYQDGTRWSAACEGRMPVWRSESGATGRPTTLPPAGEASRYHLYLHELLQQTEGSDDFAQSILNEAQGGVNIRKAAERLDYEADVSTQRNRLTKEANRLRDALREAQRDEKELAREQQRLTQLRSTLEGAREAEYLATALEQAQAVRAAQEAVRDAERALEDHDEAHAELHGEEAAQWQEAEERIEQLLRERAEAEEELERAQRANDQNILAPDGLPDDMLESLRTKQEELSRLEQSVQEQERQIDGLRKQEQQARRRLGADIDTEQLAAMERIEIEQLERDVETVERLRARSQTRRLWMELVGDVEEEADLDRLQSAVRELRRWLRAAGVPEVDLQKWPLVAGGAGIVAALLGAVLLTENALVGLGVITAGAVAAFAAWQIHRRRSTDASDERQFAEKEFAASALGEPASWSERAVRERLEELEAEVTARRFESEKAAARKRWATEWTEYDAELAGAEEALQQRARAAGIDPAWIGERTLVWFVKQLALWQEARDGRLGAEAEQAKTRDQQKRVLAAVRDDLEPFGYGEIRSAADLAGAREALQRENEALRLEEQKAKHAGQTLDRAEREIRTAREKQERIARATGIDDYGRLRRLCDEQPAYRAARQALREAQNHLEGERRRYEALAAADEEALTMESDLLIRRLEEARAAAAKKEEVSAAINRIETLVERAKDEHEIERREADYREALAELEADRSRLVDRALGGVLTNAVEEATRDQDLPEIFHRAQSIFRQITGDRYALELDREGPAFAAYDLIEEEPLALEELSSGTRVQLLLAVRVAFVEHQETGGAAPLVLDETLANSDDEKASAIIDALCALAARGRQILYLTAQADEVRKWEQRLGTREVDLTVVPLTDRTVRPLESGDGALRPAPPALPPLPDEVDHAAYREAASVPDWSPHYPVGRLPLWYVIEEVAVLRRLAEAGCQTVGQFESVLERTESARFGLDADALACIWERVRAVRTWQKAWRIGRGRPVDRRVLEAADGAVSDTFIDEVAELARKLKGDGAALVEALDEGEVFRFRSNKTDDLDAYLRREGYIDPEEPLTEEDLWRRVATAIDPEVLPTSDLQRLIERFPGMRAGRSTATGGVTKG